MANDNNIKIFNAADIEKYHKGLLSAKEMYALEKAALDDPFLADALEGYALSSVNIHADIDELKNRLSKKTGQESKVIARAAGKTTSFLWWKVAAMIVLIAGAGWIVYQFAFTKKSGDIAQTVPKEVHKAETKDSGNTTSPTLLNTDTNNKSVVIDQQEKDKSKTENNKNGSAASKKQQRQEKITAPKAIMNNADISDNAPTVAASQADIALEKKSNTFRGRVMDANNNALPFSNIINTQDNIGTYSDARGYFTLISPDSILNVQVSSLGFETNLMQLQSFVSNNNVLLQEDRSSLAEVVISSKKVNSTRSRDATMVLEEPEPADGWSNYDIYLANNLKVADVFKDKQTGIGGEVELSFEVDKNGEPFNITVKKSLCPSCDKEAIRLIKEGPKWKRKAKKRKATVTIAF